MAAIKAANALPSLDFSLRTFNVYIGSIARALRARYSNEKELDEGLLIAEILALQNYAQPRVKDRLDLIERSLRRAWATERLLCTFGSDADADMKRDALHWLPAQAYYAIHAALDALLESHHQGTKNHMAALNSFSSTFIRAMPKFPLGITCEGFAGAWKFDGFTTSPIPKQAKIIAKDEPTWCHHLAEGLKTTRVDDCVDDVEKWKRDNKKKNIPKVDRERITGRRKKTTVLHLLWRLRRRANYGDVDLFLYDAAKTKELNSFAAAMIWIVSCYVAAFEALIERRIGKPALEAMMRRFPDAATGPVDFIAARWRLKR